MALGAITPVQPNPSGGAGGVGPAVLGDLKVTVTNIVGDASYTVGGSPLTAQQLGLQSVLFAQTEVLATTGTNSAASSSAYNPATQKLVCFNNITGTLSTSPPTTECAAAVNLSGLTWQIIAFGY